MTVWHLGIAILLILIIWGTILAVWWEHHQYRRAELDRLRRLANRNKVYKNEGEK